MSYRICDPDQQVGTYILNYIIYKSQRNVNKKYHIEKKVYKMKRWEDRMNFNERLKEIRLKRELTQEELAQKINISSSSISLYERGDREPNLTTLINISKTLNVSTDYLLGLTDIESSSSHQISKDGIRELIEIFLKEINEK